MRQNMMKALSSLITAILILSATYCVAGWMQGADKVTHLNPLYAEVDKSAKWLITAPKYANPEFGEVVSGYDNPVIVRIILHDDIAALNVKYQSLDGENYVRAFSVPGVDRNGDRICFVHIVMPVDWNDKQQFQSLGHEMMHCLGAKHIGAINEAT